MPLNVPEPMVWPENVVLQVPETPVPLMVPVAVPGATAPSLVMLKVRFIEVPLTLPDRAMFGLPKAMPVRVVPDWTRFQVPESVPEYEPQYTSTELLVPARALKVPEAPAGPVKVPVISEAVTVPVSVKVPPVPAPLTEKVWAVGS
jgi:hypothetical protein